MVNNSEEEDQNSATLCNKHKMKLANHLNTVETTTRAKYEH